MNIRTCLSVPFKKIYSNNITRINFKFFHIKSFVLAYLVFIPTTLLAVAPNTFDWSMPDRLLENTSFPGYDATSPIPKYDPNALMLPTDGWLVNFDACASSTANIVSYEWTVDGTSVATVGDCLFEYKFPEEGAYQISLIITDDTGSAEVMDQEIVVQDWLIIAMGDSYGSGEGNPIKPVTAQSLVDFNILLELAENLQADVQDFLDQLPGLEEAQQAKQQLHDDALTTRNQAQADLNKLKQDLQDLVVIHNNVEADPTVTAARNKVNSVQGEVDYWTAQVNADQQDYDNCTFGNCAARLIILNASKASLAAAKIRLVEAKAELFVVRNAAVVIYSLFATIQNFSELTLAIDAKTAAVNLAQNTFNTVQNAYQNAQDALQQAIDAVLSLQSIIADLQQAWQEAKTNAQTQYLTRLPEWTSTAPSWGTDEPTYVDMVLDGATPGEALRCHRSMISGQARAALAIEQADPHTSVTLVHLACTGATIKDGLIGEYGGTDNINPILEPLLYQAINSSYTGLPEQPKIAGQIAKAVEKIGNREADAIVISIGGNDIGFAKIIEKCVLGEPCHTELGVPPSDGFDTALIDAIEQNCRPVALINLLTGLSLPTTDTFPFSDKCLATYELTEEIQQGGHALAFFNGEESKEGKPEPEPWMDKITFLEGQWANLNAKLNEHFETRLNNGGIKPLDTGRVYLTEYPDPTGDDIGNYCGWFPQQADTTGDEYRHLFGVTQNEMEWADIKIATDLRAATTAAANDYGWNFITKTGVFDETIASTSRNHGYCAVDHWIIRVPETLITQMDHNGVAHPNRDGHGNYQQAIYNQLITDFYPNGLDAQPRLPDPDTTQVVSNTNNSSGGGSLTPLILLFLSALAYISRKVNREQVA